MVAPDVDPGTLATHRPTFTHRPLKATIYQYTKKTKNTHLLEIQYINIIDPTWVGFLFFCCFGILVYGSSPQIGVFFVLVYWYIAALGGWWAKVGLCVAEGLQVRLRSYGGFRCGSRPPNNT